MFQLDDGTGGILGEDLDGILVAQIIATLYRVEHVPLPVVLLLIAKGGTDSSLGSTGMGARGKDLAKHGNTCIFPEFYGGSQTCQPGSNNYDVELMFHLTPRLGQQMMGDQLSALGKAEVRTKATTMFGSTRG